MRFSLTFLVVLIFSSSFSQEKAYVEFVEIHNEQLLYVLKGFLKTEKQQEYYDKSLVISIDIREGRETYYNKDSSYYILYVTLEQKNKIHFDKCKLDSSVYVSTYRGIDCFISCKDFREKDVLFKRTDSLVALYIKGEKINIDDVDIDGSDYNYYVYEYRDGNLIDPWGMNASLLEYGYVKDDCYFGERNIIVGNASNTEFPK